MRTHLVRAALLTAGGLLLLLGWIILGRRASDGLRENVSPNIAFSDIDCTPPEPLSRADFLNEVQYLSNCPDQLPVPDEGLAARLAAAFSAHPWVESVQRVEVLPHRVRVNLVYRKAVLAVPWSGAIRAVDGWGVLLPLTAVCTELPQFKGPISSPAGSAGVPWGDARVMAAARTAAFLQSYHDQFAVEKIEVENDEVILFLGKTKIHWGSPPGRERAGESKAAIKVSQLQKLVGQEGGLSHDEYDLRTLKENP